MNSFRLPPLFHHRHQREGGIFLISNLSKFSDRTVTLLSPQNPRGTWDPMMLNPLRTVRSQSGFTVSSRTKMLLRMSIGTSNFGGGITENSPGLAGTASGEAKAAAPMHSAAPACRSQRRRDLLLLSSAG